jgi:hypothetical protein
MNADNYLGQPSPPCSFPLVSPRSLRLRAIPFLFSLAPRRRARQEDPQKAIWNPSDLGVFARYRIALLSASISVHLRLRPVLSCERALAFAKTGPCGATLRYVPVLPLYHILPEIVKDSGPGATEKGAFCSFGRWRNPCPVFGFCATYTSRQTSIKRVSFKFGA